MRNHTLELQCVGPRFQCLGVPAHWNSSVCSMDTGGPLYPAHWSQCHTLECHTLECQTLERTAHWSAPHTGAHRTLEFIDG